MSLSFLVIYYMRLTASISSFSAKSVGGVKKPMQKKKEIDDSTPRGTVGVKRQKMTLTFHAPKPRVLRGAITSLLFFLTRATDFAINYGPLVVFLFSSYYVRIL